jgi:hypothetical protein
MSRPRSRRRHRRRRRPARGWDIVRTPFGQRVVPIGRGWREGTKWALLRTLWWLSCLIGLAAAVHHLASTIRF